MPGFRLHPVEDADIIKDLGRFTDKTKRIKEVYRRGMQLEQGIISQNAPAQTPAAVQVERQVHEFVKAWNIPEEPTVKKPQQQGSLKTNILFKNKF